MEGCKFLSAKRPPGANARVSKKDIDDAIAQLQHGIADMEKRLADTRPDLLPRADAYDQTMRRQLDGAEA